MGRKESLSRFAPLASPRPHRELNVSRDPSDNEWGLISIYLMPTPATRTLAPSHGPLNGL